MPNTELLIAFFLAASIFAYIPGPAMLYAAAQTIAGGRRAGFHAAAGLHFGGYLHVFAAAFGLAALFSAIPVLYLVLKYTGAAYLAYLGLRLIMQEQTPVSTEQPLERPPSTKTFWQSATVEMLNPKTALFFVAFLPQFADQTATLPMWGQLLVLGVIVNIMFSSADIICVILADKIKNTFENSSRMNRITRRLAGTALIGLSANLVIER